jgi:hypothetical protein
MVWYSWNALFKTLYGSVSAVSTEKSAFRRIFYETLGVDV